jgi:hypothetical protein
MIELLLQPHVREFILAHEEDDDRVLLLKHKTLFNLPAYIIANQLVGRRKAKTKIPLYYNTNNIVFPPGLNLEQSSSEETALFKSSILAEVFTEKSSLLDLTGGFGIDSLFFSKVFNAVTYCDPNVELLEYARHNHITLGVHNIQYNATSAEHFLESTIQHFDCVFIDPSRRTTSNQKVFRLTDCEPDCVALLPKIFEHTNMALIKTSPLLDIQLGIKELAHVKHVWVVSVDNECKELLFLCEKNYALECRITAINLSKEQEEFSFMFSEERKYQAQLSNPLQYLYEPNAAILKAGAFKSIANRFSLKKLHPSTHLYTSSSLIEHFPGRVFQLKKIIKADSKAALQALPEGKANVLTRNYPLSPDELKKKLKLQDGGGQYLIGCSGEKDKFLVVAGRIA